jgi:hypothetical protein
MTRWLVAFAVLVVPSLAMGAQKPTAGKVRFYVSAPEESVSKGIQQKASDLEESVRELRARLNKRKWVEVVDSEEASDIRLTILGRHQVPEKGNVLHFFIDAGAYKKDDEFAYQGDVVPTGGTRPTSASGSDSSKQGRSVLGWGELAKRFADSLEEFAQTNYERIVAQRTKS